MNCWQLLTVFLKWFIVNCFDHTRHFLPILCGCFLGKRNLILNRFSLFLPLFTFFVLEWNPWVIPLWPWSELDATISRNVIVVILTDILSAIWAKNNLKVCYILVSRDLCTSPNMTTLQNSAIIIRTNSFRNTLISRKTM